MGRTQLFCCRARFHCLLCLFTVFSTNPVRSSERCKIAQFFFIYRKIPKISPGAYIFQRPFLRVLFLEGLIFGGTYLWREICVSQSIGLALYLEENWPFLLYFSLYLREISKYKSPGGLYSAGRFNGGFFALRVWGAHIWRGLYMEGLIFGIFR